MKIPALTEFLDGAFEQITPEAAVICACLKNRDHVGLCFEMGLSPEAFKEPVYRDLFQVICRFFLEDKELCPIAVGMEAGRNVLHRVHEGIAIKLGIEFIEPCAPRYFIAKLLQDQHKSDVTRKIDELKSAVQAGENPNSKVNELYEMLGNDPSSPKFKSNDEVLADITEEIQDKMAARGNGIELMLSTGFNSLDKETGGWSKKGLHTLAARTGQGKTTLAINFALWTAIQGKHVLFFSSEMGRDEIFAKMISRIGLIPFDLIRDGRLDEPVRGSPNKDYGHVFMNAVEYLRTLPIRVISSFPSGVETVFSEIAIHRHMGKCDFVVLDYVQRFADQMDARIAKHERVAQITSRLKDACLGLGIPALVLAQFNRQLNDNEVPSLNNLKDSSNIAMDSDQVYFLHSEGRDLQKTNLVVAKHRHGKGSVFLPLRFEAELNYLGDARDEPKTILSQIGAKK